MLLSYFYSVDNLFDLYNYRRIIIKKHYLGGVTGKTSLCEERSYTYMKARCVEVLNFAYYELSILILA